MGSTIAIEVVPRHEGIVRRALALAEEMEQLALETGYTPKIGKKEKKDLTSS